LSSSSGTQPFAVIAIAREPQRDVDVALLQRGRAARVERDEVGAG
jgi:hypothetical protein